MDMELHVLFMAEDDLQYQKKPIIDDYTTARKYIDYI